MADVALAAAEAARDGVLPVEGSDASGRAAPARASVASDLDPLPTNRSEDEGEGPAPPATDPEEDGEGEASAPGHRRRRSSNLPAVSTSLATYSHSKIMVALSGKKKLQRKLTTEEEEDEEGGNDDGDDATSVGGRSVGRSSAGGRSALDRGDSVASDGTALPAGESQRLRDLVASGRRLSLQQVAMARSLVNRHRNKKTRKRRAEDRYPLGCGGNRRHHEVSMRARLLRDVFWFQAVTIFVIVVAAVQVGVQTYNFTDPMTKSVLDWLDLAVIIFFCAESLVKITAEGKEPFKYFSDPWNSFDFLILVASIVPYSLEHSSSNVSGGGFTSIFRTLRLVRVVRLIRVLPELRILVTALWYSLNSIGYVGVLLLLFFNIYGVIGVTVFGTNDPVQFGNLLVAWLSLFRAATLDDWQIMLQTNMLGCDRFGYERFPEECVAPSSHYVASLLYFISFVFMAYLIFINLIIGVVTTAIEEAREVFEKEELLEQQENKKTLDFLLGTTKNDEQANVPSLEQREAEKLEQISEVREGRGRKRGRE